MYLDRIEIENFRLCGEAAAGRHLSAQLMPGINLLIGPNDAGKTCLIDAIRLLVGTVTADYQAITEDDFHIRGNKRASRFSIAGEFRGLDEEECGALLEYLSIDIVDGSPRYFLRLRLSASLLNGKGSARRKRVRVEVRAGADEEGVFFDSHAREILAATYLKPLRDAVTELTSRRGSRLSQILRAYQHIDGHENSDWHPESTVDPKTLMGIAMRADHAFRNCDVIQKAISDINTEHLSEFSIGDNPLKGDIAPAVQELRQVLERFELRLADGESNTFRGLGVYNLLFIATELLALAPGDDVDLPLLLIEEPEAHLHPQYQQRLIEYIRQKAKSHARDERKKLQVILSSHSPHFASHVALNNITLMHGGRAFSLRQTETELEEADYGFLERFLDVTKANLFFASGVLIVEGDAEALLLPVLARLLGRQLDRYGVSIVNVGHRGLFRYSRIFKRQGESIPVRVACLADRDILPVEAKDFCGDRRTLADYSESELATHIEGLRKNDGQLVRTFVSDRWTLEYDLAMCGLARYMHQAISLAKLSKTRQRAPAADDYRDSKRTAAIDFRRWLDEAKSPEEIAWMVHKPLWVGHASKPETAQILGRLLSRLEGKQLSHRLPKYIVDAINYVTGAPTNE